MTTHWLDMPYLLDVALFHLMGKLKFKDVESTWMQRLKKLKEITQKFSGDARRRKNSGSKMDLQNKGE